MVLQTPNLDKVLNLLGLISTSSLLGEGDMKAQKKKWSDLKAGYTRYCKLHELQASDSGCVTYLKERKTRRAKQSTIQPTEEEISGDEIEEFFIPNYLDGIEIPADLSLSESDADDMFDHYKRSMFAGKFIRKILAGDEWDMVQFPDLTEEETSDSEFMADLAEDRKNYPIPDYLSDKAVCAIRGAKSLQNFHVNEIKRILTRTKNEVA
jgi:hypothetical protein